MNTTSGNGIEPDHKDPVQQRLLNAAFELFLHTDYNKVTTRQLAKKADTSVSMIPYYFNDKQGLYNEMVRQQFKQIGQALEDAYSEEQGIDFNKLLLSYLDIHNKHPDFPAFITNIIAYKNGPGYMLFAEILDAKRERLQKIIQSCQQKNQLSQHIDIDVFRITMMSLTVFPFLIKGVLGHSKKMTMSDDLLDKVARLAGAMLNEFTTEHDALWQSFQYGK